MQLGPPRVPEPPLETLFEIFAEQIVQAIWVNQSVNTPVDQTPPGTLQLAITLQTLQRGQNPADYLSLAQQLVACGENVIANQTEEPVAIPAGSASASSKVLHRSNAMSDFSQFLGDFPPVAEPVIVPQAIPAAALTPQLANVVNLGRKRLRGKNENIQEDEEDLKGRRFPVDN